jgi:long-chain fatty acid transport protein
MHRRRFEAIGPVPMSGWQLKKTGLILVTAFGLAPQFAYATGYALRENSADAMSAAYAGSTATDTDASYIAYNPAALGAVRDFDISESATAILPDNSSHYSATTSASTPVGGPSSSNSFIPDAFVPSLALRWRITDRVVVGLSVSSPWGLSAIYPANWVGRYYIIDSKLKTFNIRPLISYEVLPGVTLAAGPQIQYASGTLSNAIDVGTLTEGSGGTPGGDDIRAQFKARGWSFGWTAGILLRASDTLSVGAAYRSANPTVAKGSLTFQGVSTNPFALGIGIFNDGPARTRLTTPATVSVGARWRVRDRWTLLGNVDWTQWSAFQSLQITTPNPLLSDFTAMSWHNSPSYSLGAEYTLSDRWTLKGGTEFDETPVPATTVSPRIADTNRYWLSFGARYRATDSIDLALSYAHLFYPQAHIDLHQTDTGSALRGNLSGTSQSATNIIALQLDFHTN